PSSTAECRRFSGDWMVLSSNFFWCSLRSARTIPRMPSTAVPTSPAIAKFLRERRESLGLTLRAVQKLSGELGNPIPHSTLARIESARLDPGVRRLQQLLRLYKVPTQTAGDLLDIEELTGPSPLEREPRKLRDRAVASWRVGNVADALACF